METRTQQPRGRALPCPPRPRTRGRFALLLSVAALAALALLSVGSPSAQAQARDVPGAPQNVRLVAGDGKLTLTWIAPASWGSFPAKGYEIDVAAGRWYGSADPPANTHGDWEVLASPGPTATSYTFTGRIFGNSVIHSYRHTVTNGTRYHLRIRAVSAPAGDPSDEVPGFWIVKSAAPVAPGFTVTPSTLTVPVGSRACYLVSPTTLPAAAVTITANTAALSAEIGGSTVTYATTFDPDTGDWGTSGDEDRKIGSALCVKGVTVTTSPVTITHTATSDDTDYDGVTVPSVTLTVSAADSTPVVRFLHASMRVVEGDSNLAAHYPVDNLSLHRFVVRLDIAPAPSSAGHVIWHVPHPDCNGVTQCAYPASTSTTYNIDYVAQWLFARRVFYSAGSNDMQFEFLIRADDFPEDDETVTIYLQDQSFEVGTGFTPNTAVCVGACSSPTQAQQSVVVTIIDDDAGEPECAGCARGGELGRIAIPPRSQDLGQPPDGPQQQQEEPPAPPANRAPTLSSPLPDATIVHERGTETSSLSGVFADADNDALTVSAASSNEAVATVSVAADYSSLTVTARSRGTATITVTADDGAGGTVEDTFTVTVKSAPTVASAIGDMSLEAEATRDVSLSGVFSDPDGDALTITTDSSDDAIANAVVSADQSGLTLTGVAGGTATVTVTAEDADGNRVGDAFEVTVAAAQAALSGIAARYDANGDGAIDGSEYQQVKNDWLSGKISYDEFLEVVRVHIRSG